MSSRVGARWIEFQYPAAMDEKKSLPRKKIFGLNREGFYSENFWVFRIPLLWTKEIPFLVTKFSTSIGRFSIPKIFGPFGHFNTGRQWTPNPIRIPRFHASPKFYSEPFRDI